MGKTIQDLKIDFKNLESLSKLELIELFGHVRSMKAGSFMGAVKKQYYLRELDRILKLVNNKEQK